jgi:hypothetical protein
VHHVEDSAFPGQLSDFDHIFHENGGFDVSGSDRGAFKTGGAADYRFGRKFIVHSVIRAGLRDFPVLAKFAVEVAPGCGNGKRPGGWQNMEKGLLFHRVDIDCAGISVNKGIVLSVFVFSDTAISAFSVSGFASPRTKLATHAFIGKRCKVG